MRRLDMLKAREILRLKHEVRLSLREIGKSRNCSKSTLSGLSIFKNQSLFCMFIWLKGG
jgi:hypothetical protein